MNIYKHFGITGLELNINSLGCPECRKKYNEALRAFLEGKKRRTLSNL